MNVGIAGLDAVAHVNMARSDVTSSSKGRVLPQCQDMPLKLSGFTFQSQEVWKSA